MSDGRGHEPPYPRNERPLILLLALGLVLATSLGTQYVAWRFRFDPRLGPPAVVFSSEVVRSVRSACVLGFGSALASFWIAPIRRTRLPSLLLLLALLLAIGTVGPVYAPQRIIVWQLRSTHGTGAAVLRAGWVVVGVASVMISVVITAVWRRRSSASVSDSHGSAHWGNGAALYGDAGLVLGHQEAQALRYAGEGHVLTVAPTRSGKGVSCVIPNLLDHPGSVLVTDPKGENYAVTARWRRHMGQGVHAFDPFGVVDGQATYNPLDLVNVASPEAVDDARMLADMIVLTEGREGEQVFWNEEARGLLTGLILHAAASARPELRTLAHVRTLLTLSPSAFAQLLNEMQASDAAGGLVARAAARILQKADKERSGVISTAQSHTHFLDSPRMARVLQSSTMDLAELKRDRASVYLVLPSDRLDAYARWQRLMIACALLAVARARGQAEARVLFLLDEFAHLGRMQPVVRDIGLAGGFGVTFWLIVQDLSQLRSTYGEAWQTFLANADVLQAFGANDWDTSEYLSKMTGDATIRVASENESRGVSRGQHSQQQLGAALSVSERGRRLLLPDEVRRLPGRAQLLFVKGSAPLLVDRLNYLQYPDLALRADPNPLYDLVAQSAS